MAGTPDGQDMQKARDSKVNKLEEEVPEVKGSVEEVKGNVVDIFEDRARANEFVVNTAFSLNFLRARRLQL